MIKARKPLLDPVTGNTNRIEMIERKEKLLSRLFEAKNALILVVYVLEGRLRLDD
jgi:hypothetical protein